MSDETYIETERVRSRADIAAYLHEFATRFEEGEVSFEEEGGERFTVAAPSRALFEVEVEREEEDDETEYEIEFEIEWLERWNEPGDESEADVAADAEPAGGEESTEERESTEEGESAAEEEPAPAPAEDREAMGPLSVTTPPESRARFELFEDRAGQWRWRLVHDNGNIVADSGEGYTTKWNAEKGLRSVVRNAPGAEVIEREREP